MHNMHDGKPPLKSSQAAKMKTIIHARIKLPRMCIIEYWSCVVRFKTLLNISNICSHLSNELDSSDSGRVLFELRKS